MLHKDVNEILAWLFIHGSTHRNSSVFYSVHNSSWRSKVARKIELNAKYIITFWSPNDQQPLMTIGQQIFPRQLDYFKEALDYCMNKKHGY